MDGQMGCRHPDTFSEEEDHPRISPINADESQFSNGICVNRVNLWMIIFGRKNRRSTTCLSSWFYGLSSWHSPLFLFARGVLHAPTFYLSEYLEAHRQEYCDRLLAVSRDDDWTGWCVFFLQALGRQARDNEAKTRRILALYQEKKDWMVNATHSQYAIHAWDFLFQRPVFRGSAFVENASIPAGTARRLLKVLRDEGLLHELWPARGRKSAIFAFRELLNIAEGKPVFLSVTHERQAGLSPIFSIS